MLTLGINAAFHDPAAAIVHDGVVLAASEEERYTHIKHGKRPSPFSAHELPFHAIDHCLRQAGAGLKDVDHIAYSFDPELTADVYPGELNGIFLNAVERAPFLLAGDIPHHLKKRFADVSPYGPFRWHFVDHHLAHAASAFIPSPYDHAAVLVLDGRGEQATTTFWNGQGNHLTRLGQVNMPHSLGMLYEELTAHLGFLRSSDEYKVMALAAMGKPKYAAWLRRHVHVDGSGQFTLDPIQWPAEAARESGGPVTEVHCDLAHSVQLILEETVLRLCQWLQQKTDCSQLCLAGGVALNCVMNGVIRDSGIFRHIWVQPAAGDAGTALGAALFTDIRERQETHRRYKMDHVYLGPSFEDAEIEAFLKWSKLPYRKLDDVAEETADYLQRGKIIGWFQRGMEFGPRALGARSLLAAPFPASMQDRMNELKDREDFRPVAPVVPEEDAEEWFLHARKSPFMLFVNQIRPERQGEIPAVRHLDGTTRIQTVNERQNPLYYRLLRAFGRRTGVPVLINTSFNTRGEPIVCTPRDAVESFWTSPVDVLVIGSYVLEKP